MTAPLMDDADVMDDEPHDGFADDTDAESTAPDATDGDDSAGADIDADDDSGQPTTAEGEADPASAAVPVPSSAPVPEPLKVSAHGKALTVEGATMTPAGIQFATDAVRQRIQSLLSRGYEMETYGRPRLRELEAHNTELQQSRAQGEVHANAIIQWFEEIRQNPQALIDAVEQWDRFGPAFDARVERALFEQERQQWQRQQKAQEMTPQEQYAAAVEQVRTIGQEEMGKLAPQHGLSEPEAALIAKRLLRKPDAYLVEVNGQPAFDDEQFAADVAEEAALRQQSRATMTKVQDAATRNAATRAGTIPAQVKAPPAKVSPTPPRDDRNGRFKSKDEWEAWGMGER